MNWKKVKDKRTLHSYLHSLLLFEYFLMIMYTDRHYLFTCPAILLVTVISRVCLFFAILPSVTVQWIINNTWRIWLSTTSCFLQYKAKFHSLPSLFILSLCISCFQYILQVLNFLRCLSWLCIQETVPFWFYAYMSFLFVIFFLKSIFSYFFFKLFSLSVSLHARH